MKWDWGKKAGYVLLTWLVCTLGLQSDIFAVEGLHLQFTLDAPTFREREAYVIAEQLKRFGIEVSVEIWPKSSLNKEIEKKTRTAYLTDWGSAFFDPFDLAMPKILTGGRGNYSFYSNAATDDFLVRSMSEPAIRKRKELLHNAQYQIFHDAPWVFGYTLENVAASSTRVLNFTTAVDDRINLHDVRLSDGNTLVVGMNCETFITLDPAMHRRRETETVIRNIFDGLVTRSPDGMVVPEIASGWEIVNSREIVFQIRKGVLFHDGSPLTADDVVFTFNRILKSGSIDGKSSPRKGLLGPLTKVEKIDDYTVKLFVSTPFPPMLQALVHFQIVPKAYIEKVGDAVFAVSPVGSGPFQYLAGNSDSEIVLKRFPEYYGGSPALPPVEQAKIEKVVFKPVSDSATRIKQLIAGDLSIIQSVPVDQVNMLRKHPDITVSTAIGTRSFQIELNNLSPPFNDLKVRQALNHAINWREVLNTIYTGHGQRITTCFLPSGFGYDSNLEPYEFNPGLAVKLLSEAGYRSEYSSLETQVSGDRTDLIPLKEVVQEIDIKSRPKSVTIASSNGSYPFHFVDNNGEPAGMFVDLWKLWSRAAQIDVEFKPSSWNRTIINVDEGIADIHAGLFKSVARDKILDFSVPLQKCDTHFFFHKSLLEVEDLEDLIPFKIGIIKGDYALDFIRQRLPAATIAIYEDNRSLFDAVESGEIKVFIKDTPIARHHLLKRRLSREFKYFEHRPLYSNMFHAAVKEGNARMVSLIQEGMDKISIKEITDLQRKWLGSSDIKTEDILVIGLLEGNLPLSGTDFEGRPSGLLVDFWRLWARKMEQPIEFKIVKANQIIPAMETGEIDVLGAVMPESEFSDHLILSQPFYSLEASAFRSPGTPPFVISKTKPDSVGGIRSFGITESLKHRYPSLVTRLFTSHEKAILAVIKGELPYLVDFAPIALRDIDQLGLTGQIVYDDVALLTGAVCAGVRKHHNALAKQVNQGVSQILTSEIAEIEKRWILSDESRQIDDHAAQVWLTQDEVDWVENHKTIRLGVDPNWPPIDFLDKTKSVHMGMASSFLDLLSQRLGLTFEVVPVNSWNEVLEKSKEREIDVIGCLKKTDDRSDFLNFTAPYLSFPMVIITRNDAALISGVSSLEGKRIAVGEQYAIQEKLLATNDFQPSLQGFPSPIDGLIAVSTGKMEAYIGNMVVTGYLIQKHSLTNLKIAAPVGATDTMDEFRLGVRNDWPLLVTILNKGLASITESERTAIQQEWFSIRFEHGIDKAYVKTIALRIGVAFVAILAIILVWNRLLKKEINRRLVVEEKLVEAKEDAESANKAKSIFLSNMSHEIRTPMNAILGFSQMLLRDTAIREENKRHLRTIWRSGEHLLGLINNILEMSKIEAGRITLDTDSFDLFILLDDVEIMFEELTHSKGLSFSVERADTVPQYIKADQRKIRQIIINLLGNAVKYTVEGGILLQVDYKSDEQQVRFEIRDTGYGISAENMDKIFQHFEQTESARITGGGTGLGLAISRNYAQAMRGNITVESELNKGSAFIFEANIELANGVDVRGAESPKRAVRLASDQESLRILVVDDQPANRELMLYLLNEVGFTTEEAHSGETAIDKYKEFKPHLILMDIVMNGIDGVEATSRIKRLPGSEKCVIFALTASVLDEEKNRILNSGAVEFIRKPYRESDLFEKIAKHLDVRFEYEERQIDLVEDSISKNNRMGKSESTQSLVDMLTHIPPDLRDLLLQAALNGYKQTLDELIRDVRNSHPDLAAELKSRVDAYEYNLLVEALKQADKKHEGI